MGMHGQIILSCTTTKDRLEFLYYTVKSVYRQTLKPDVFYINISQDSHMQDSGIKEPPTWLNNENIVVNFVENTGPYRKLLPVLSKSSEEDIIVTIDDDVLYHRNWLKTIVETAMEHPAEIVCGRAKKINKNVLGLYQSYYNWRRVKTSCSGFWLLPIGCAGVAYRKNLINEEFIKDGNFLKIAKANDDLWFRMASLINGVNVYVNRDVEIGNITLVHNKGLELNNVFSINGNSMTRKLTYELFGRTFGYLGASLSDNDTAWKKIIRYSNFDKLAEGK